MNIKYDKDILSLSKQSDFNFINFLSNIGNKKKSKYSKDIKSINTSSILPNKSFTLKFNHILLSGGSFMIISTLSVLGTYHFLSPKIIVEKEVPVFKTVSVPVIQEKYVTFKDKNMAPMTLPDNFNLKDPKHIDNSVVKKQPVLNPIKISIKEPVYINKGLANYITKKYSIAKEASLYIVSYTFEKSKQFGIDPYIMLAIIAQESRFNPLAGSFANAKGLTQVMVSAHPEKIAKLKSKNDILTIEGSIATGLPIFKDCKKRFKSDISALQCYNGNMADKSHRYATKVLNIKRSFKQF